MTEAAPDGVDIDAVDVYWRRGCPWCVLLRQRLKGTGVPVRYHDIWEDPAAALVVREAAGGNETVPTVRVGDRALVNPSAGAVRRLVAEVAPHLIPDEPPRRGWLQRRLPGGG